MALPAPVRTLIFSDPSIRVQRALVPRLLALAAARGRVDGAPELEERTARIVRLADWMGAMDFEALDPASAREQMEVSSRLMAPPPRGMRRVENLEAGGAAGPIAVRLYEPHSAPREPPVLVYFHGGGWVVGSLDTHDGLCRVLADEAGLAVLSVDYRLAPEHPFPAAVDDAMCAYEWVLDNARRLGVDGARVAVGGDSAGGTLSAVVAQQARSRRLAMPRFQLLIYPATDLRRLTASNRTLAEGYLLTGSLMDWFLGHYLADAADKTDPRASPLLADDLGGLPEAYVVTAGFDPLRDEGRAYADRLRQAGVRTRYVCQAGLVHGFANMTYGIPAARRAVSDAAGALARGISPRRF